MEPVYVESPAKQQEIWDNNGSCKIRFASILCGVGISDGHMYLSLQNFEKGESKKDQYFVQFPHENVYCTDFAKHLRSTYHIDIPQNMNVKRWSCSKIYLKNIIILDVLGNFYFPSDNFLIQIEGSVLIRNLPDNVTKKVANTVKQLWKNLDRLDSDPINPFSFKKIQLLTEKEQAIIDDLRAPVPPIETPDVNLYKLFESDDEEEETKSEKSLISQFSDSDIEEFIDASDVMSSSWKRKLNHTTSNDRERISVADDSIKKKLRLAKETLENVQQYGQEIVSLVSIATQTDLSHKDIRVDWNDDMTHVSAKKPQAASRYKMVVEERSISLSNSLEHLPSKDSIDQRYTPPVGSSTQPMHDSQNGQKKYDAAQQDAVASLFEKKRQMHQSMSQNLSTSQNENYILSVESYNKILSRNDAFSFNSNEYIMKGKLVGILPTQQMISSTELTSDLEKLIFIFCLEEDISDKTCVYNELNSVYVHCTDIPWLLEVLKLQRDKLLMDVMDLIYLKTLFNTAFEELTNFQVVIVKETLSDVAHLQIVPYKGNRSVIFEITSLSRTKAQQQQQHLSKKKPPLKPEDTKFIKDIYVGTAEKKYIAVVGLFLSLEYVQRWNQYRINITDFTHNDQSVGRFDFEPYLIDRSRPLESDQILKCSVYPDKMDVLKSRFESCIDKFDYREFTESGNVSKFGVICRFDLSVKLYNGRLDAICHSLWPITNESILPDVEKKFLYAVRKQFYQRLSTTDIESNLEFIKQFTPLQFDNTLNKFVLSSAGNGFANDNISGNNNAGAGLYDKDPTTNSFQLELFHEECKKSDEYESSVPSGDVDQCRIVHTEHLYQLKSILNETTNVIYEFVGTIVSAEVSMYGSSMVELRIGDPTVANDSNIATSNFNNDNTVLVHVLFPKNIEHCFRRIEMKHIDMVGSMLRGRNVQFYLKRVKVLITPVQYQLMWVPISFDIKSAIKTMI